MIKLKHTPGPWAVMAFSDFVDQTGAETICKFFDRNENNYRNKEANARLIATAPEMLDVLISELSFMVKTTHNDSNIDLLKKSNVAKVIEKATSQKIEDILN